MSSNNASAVKTAARQALGASSANWPDELWAESVGRCDAVLRSFYGVREFTNDPTCVFRVGSAKVRATLSLSDGTVIRSGETVGTLHFWNEHLPRQNSCGPGLGWACVMRSRVLHSLAALAEYVETDHGWREIPAFQAEAGLSTRLGSFQVERVVQRYGFERAASSRSLLRRVHDLGDDFLLWGFARAFNPGALTRSRFFRDHHELWISRTSLLRHHLPWQQNANGAASRGGA
jgi:YkoP domain